MRSKDILVHLKNSPPSMLHYLHKTAGRFQRVSFLQKSLFWYFLGISFFFIIWHMGALKYPELIIPSVMVTLERVYVLLYQENQYVHIGITMQRAFTGFMLSITIGTLLGVIAGMHKKVYDFIYPIERIIVSVPPIAWIILTLIWFGGNGILSASLTVFIASLPMVFSNANNAVRQFDTRLLQMGHSFQMSRTKAILYIGGTHIITYMYPAISIAFGQSWKVAVMAEVLGAPNGIGAQIAIARVNMETPDVFAWITVIVIFYALADYAIMKPLKKYTMRWK